VVEGVLPAPTAITNDRGEQYSILPILKINKQTGENELISGIRIVFDPRTREWVVTTEQLEAYTVAGQLRYRVTAAEETRYDQSNYNRMSKVTVENIAKTSRGIGLKQTLDLAVEAKDKVLKAYNITLDADPSIENESFISILSQAFSTSFVRPRDVTSYRGDEIFFGIRGMGRWFSKDPANQPLVDQAFREAVTVARESDAKAVPYDAESIVLLERLLNVSRVKLADRIRERVRAEWAHNKNFSDLFAAIDPEGEEFNIWIKGVDGRLPRDGDDKPIYELTPLAVEFLLEIAHGKRVHPAVIVEHMRQTIYLFDDATTSGEVNIIEGGAINRAGTTLPVSNLQ